MIPARVGVISADLGIAIARALRMDRSAAAVYGSRFSWARATDLFVAALDEAARPAEVAALPAMA